MAIAFNAASDGGNNGGTTTSLTWSHTVGSGTNRLLVVAVAGDTTTDDVTGVTYNGVAMTLAAKQTTVFTNNRKTYLYYLLNPASGAHNVVVSCTGTHYLLAGAADYSGVAQSGQPDATQVNIGANTNLATLTTSITTVADNSWAILVENGYAANALPTAGTGDTRRTADAALGTWGLFDSNADIHPAGSYSMTTNRSPSTDSIIHVIASFAPATSGTNSTISPVQGSYAVTGKPQTLNAARAIAAAEGSYTLTGKTVTFNQGKGLAAVQGSYALTGKTVTFAEGLSVHPVQGSYAITGTAPQASWGLAALAVGLYTVTGKPQSFGGAFSVHPVQGSYTVSGRAQVLTNVPFGSDQVVHGNPFFATPGHLTNIP